MFAVIKHLRKMYDATNGVREFDLEIAKGEFITLLGPSGCGKTTVLRMLGGFLTPDRGQILLDGKDITPLAPEERPVSTVFQNYSLFSHLSVLDNVAFGLIHAKKQKKLQARELSLPFVELVGLSGYEHTPVTKLSGGQMQRVAIARSLAIEPDLLLMDEPFSNLDAALRTRLRKDLKLLQKKLKMTLIFVTHDQEEALSLSDRIVVMDQGEIRQIGSPKDVYYEPQNDFVRDFFGGIEAQFSVRSEELELVRGGDWVIRNGMFYGSFTEYDLERNGETVRVTVFGKHDEFHTGEQADIRPIETS